MIIASALTVLEEAVTTLQGMERRELCELMQRLQDLTGVQANLAAQREVLGKFHGRAWPAPRSSATDSTTGWQ